MSRFSFPLGSAGGGSGGGGGGLSNVVDDATPQLGGSLDVNGNKIVSVSNGNIDIEPNGTGDVLLGNFTFDADQSVGAGQDNYVLTYDDATGKISLEVATGGGGGGGATTALDNLASVAINTALISDTASTDDIGSSAIPWKDGFFDGELLNAQVNNNEIGFGTANFMGMRYASATSLRLTVFGGDEVTITNTLVSINNNDFQVTAGDVSILGGGSLYIQEAASANADVAGRGQNWMLNSSPCAPWFTDDTGSDYAYVLDTQAQTLTNKTIDGDNQTSLINATAKAMLVDGDDTLPATAAKGEIIMLDNGKTYKATATNTWTELYGADSSIVIDQNSQSAAYTTVLSDGGKHILHPSADTTARTFTIDSNANVAYPIGTAISFVNQNGAGVVTIAITTDTMRLAGAGTTGSRTLAANGVATAVKVTSTEWIISGTGLT